MRIEIIQNGRTLRQYTHEGQFFVEAPPEGDYHIKLTNDSPKRRLVVLSVDGVNVIDGATADFKGPGYCLMPWQVATIKGWRRSDTEVASFQFKPQEASYANQTGRGTSNTGVIGVAVFDEKEKPQVHIPWTPPVHIHHHHYQEERDWGRPIGTRFTTTSTTTTSTSGDVNSRINERAATKGLDPSGNVMRGGPPILSETMDSDISETLCSTGGAIPASANFAAAAAAAPSQTLGGIRSSRSRGLTPEASMNLGTGYGEKTYMYTSTTEFDRLENPTEILTLRYAVRAKLHEWGVPVMSSPPPVEAFPASRQAVAAPPGWRG